MLATSRIIVRLTRHHEETESSHIVPIGTNGGDVWLSRARATRARFALLLP